MDHPTTSAADSAIKTAVIDALVWLPEIDPVNVGVAVTDGIVTLSGEVRTYSEKLASMTAAAGAAGVVAVVDDLETRATGAYGRGDIEVAKDVVAGLSALGTIASPAVHAFVRDGIVTLIGEVESNGQRESAGRTVQQVAGVRAVSNELRLSRRGQEPGGQPPRRTFGPARRTPEGSA
jgi:osmotically-inducible protein OsmY